MQAKKWLFVLVGFIILIVGWALSIQAVTGYRERNEQAALIKSADSFMDKELYVRAIPLYEQALNEYSLGNENELQTILLDAYLKRGDTTSYNSMVEQRMKEGIATESEYITYAENCFDTYDGKKGIQICKDGLACIESDGLRDLYESHRYEYSIRYTGYEEVLPVLNGYAPAYDGESWCYIDSKGRRQGNVYESATRFNDNGIAVIKTGGKFFAINLNEEKYGVDETHVDDVLGLSSSSILAKKDGKYGFYSYDFILRSENLIFDYITGQASDRFAVKNADGWGIISTDGEVVVPIGTYEDVAINSVGTAYAYGTAVVKTSDGWKLIDRDGNYRNGNVFEDAKAPESDGYIAVANSEGKWGFANTSGDVVIDYKYDDAKSFSDGLAAVKKNGYWHYISVYDKTAIDLDIDDANPFHNGNAISYYGGSEAIISLVYYEK